MLSCVICFNFVLDVLIVVYATGVYLRLKLSITCFSLWTDYYFIIESIDVFYFVNNFVVYKALLVQEKGSKVVYKIFIVNIVSMHLSATWQFARDLLEGLWIELQWGKKPRGGGEREGGSKVKAKTRSSSRRKNCEC